MSETTVKALDTGKRAPKYTRKRIMKYFEDHDKEKRYQLVSFESKNGYDPRGIVDMLAIRRNHKIKEPLEKPLKPGDKFDIILIDIKGSVIGKPKKTSEDGIQRLKKVCELYHAKLIVHAEYQKQGNKEWIIFQKLNAEDLWEQINDLKEIFK